MPCQTVRKPPTGPTKGNLTTVGSGPPSDACIPELAITCEHVLRAHACESSLKPCLFIVIKAFDRS